MISLKYGTYNGTNMEWSGAVEFDPLEFFEYPDADRVNGRTLRQAEYSHRLSKRNVYKLTISADELADNDKAMFCKNFFKADAWILYGEGLSEEIEVVLSESGRAPFVYINNNKKLPEISFTLIGKYSLNNS